MPNSDKPQTRLAEQKVWHAPELEEIVRDDAAMLGNLISFGILLVVWTLFGIAWLTVASLATSRPGVVEIDEMEMSEARRYENDVRASISAMQAELGILDERIANRRLDRLAKSKASPAVTPADPKEPLTTIDQDLDLPETPILYDRVRVDEATNLYIQSFVSHSGASGQGLQAIATADEKVRTQLAGLILRGAQCGHADLVIASMALNLIDCPEIQREFIDVVLKHPDPLAGPARGEIIEEQIADVMLKFCVLLPHGRRGDAVKRILYHFPECSDSQLKRLRRGLADFDTADWKAMAGLVVHPSPTVRQFVCPHVAKTDALEAVESAVKGKDFPNYTGAAAWFSEQQFDPRIRGLSESLRNSENRLLSVEQCTYLLDQIRTP